MGFLCFSKPNGANKKNKIVPNIPKKTRRGKEGKHAAESALAGQEINLVSTQDGL